MSALSKNVWPILMILASVWGVWAYIMPGYNDIVVLQTEKSQYEEAISNANEVTFLRGQLLNTYNAISKENWDRLATLLPDSIDRVKLGFDVNGVAVQNGIKLSSFQVENTVLPEATPPVQPA